MGTGHLADTNAIIDYLGNKLPKKATIFIDNLEMQLSVISKIELLAWTKISSQQFHQLSDFIASSIVFNLSEEVVQHTIEIRKSFNLKLPDAVIAATALAHNLVLITRNTSDFKRIEKLNLLNPWDIS